MSADDVYLGELEQLLLLAILQCEDDAYTLSISAMLAERGGRRLSRGALFTSLDRLEGKGFLRSWMGEPLAVRGGRPRRYFEVTRSGLSALRAAQRAMRTMAEGLDLDALLEPRR